MTVRSLVRRSIASAGPVLILLCVSVGALLLGLAMSRYPGGTAIDPTTVGHSFWFNFLCDLTNAVAVNGRPNDVGALLSRLALLSFCLALVLFWIIVPGSFGSGPAGRQSLLITTLGLVSVAGLLVVPVAKGWLHIVAVFASSVPALCAGILASVATVRYSRSVLLVGIAWATVLTAAVDSILYARSYLILPRVVHPALPLFQRLALLFMLFWMAAVAFRALRTKADVQAGTNR